jgi:hypothetical protein
MKKLSYALLALSISGVLGWAQTLTNYQATVTNQAPNYYYTFDGNSFTSRGTNATVVSWTTVPTTFTQFGTDMFGNFTNAAFFATKNDLWVDPSAASDLVINSGAGGVATSNSTASGSISLLFKSLPPGINTAQKYIFSAGNTGANHNMCALLFQNTNTSLGFATNSLVMRFGDKDTMILPYTNVIPNTWYYFAFTYTEATNGYYDVGGTNYVNKGKWYLGVPGGALASGETTNALDAVAGQGALYFGNSTATTAGFAEPGSGFLDEFATWTRRLSDAEVQAQFSKLPLLVTVTNVAVIVNDSFADGNRTNTGPLQANWWSSSSSNGNSIAAYPNKLRLISGTAGRGIHGTFAPQTLGIGDTIKATYTFTTPATVGVNRSTAFKAAMMNFNNAGLAGDLEASATYTNTLYVGLPGYMTDFDVNTGVTADVSYRKHDVASPLGSFLLTTSEWINQSSSPDAGYAILPNTNYVGVISVTRTGSDSASVFGSLSQGTNLLHSWTGSDGSAIANNFGMIGFWVNSVTFGSVTNAGEFQDNGITFSNVKVEVLTTSIQPPAAPILSIVASGGNAIISWPSSTEASYALQTATNLTTPTWISGGSPTVVGSSYVVTNPISAASTFYRLRKP